MNHVDDDFRREALPSDWDMWITDRPIGTTFSMIADAAVAQGWDTDTVLIQDDIRGELPEVDEFTVFGTQRVPRHTCPHAFVADRETWGMIQQMWAGKPKSLCVSWTNLVIELKPPILNSVVHLGRGM